MHSFFCKTVDFLFQLLACHNFYFCLAEDTIHNRVYQGMRSTGQTSFFVWFFFKLLLYRLRCI